MSKELLFEVNGFKVRKDSRYLVQDKPDLDAPSAYVEARVSRLPSSGVGDTFHFNFIPTSVNGVGVWDTGFEPTSPCYKEQTEAESKVLSDIVVKNVLKPYRKAVSQPDIFAPTNEASFLKNSFTVKTGDRFDTKDITKVMELYAALLAKRVMPEELKGSPHYNECSYVIIDLDQSVKEKDDNGNVGFEAIRLYSLKQESDPEVLKCILEYMEMPRTSDTMPKEAKNAIFFNQVSSYPESARNFNELIEESSTEVGKAKLLVFSKLKAMVGKGGKLTRPDGKYFYYEGIEIGLDLKTASENVAKNPKLKEALSDILSN